MPSLSGVTLLAIVMGVPTLGQQLPDGRGGFFDAGKHSIALEAIRAGGPPRDGIPALTDPEFVPAPSGDRFLQGDDRVLGVVYQGQAKAYPIKILNWHEVVNDRIAGRPIAVSW